MSARALLLIPLFLPLACTQASGETQGGSDNASESDATTASGSMSASATMGTTDAFSIDHLAQIVAIRDALVADVMAHIGRHKILDDITTVILKRVA